MKPVDIKSFDVGCVNVLIKLWLVESLEVHFSFTLKSLVSVLSQCNNHRVSPRPPPVDLRPISFQSWGASSPPPFAMAAVLLVVGHTLCHFQLHTWSEQGDRLDQRELRPQRHTSTRPHRHTSTNLICHFETGCFGRNRRHEAFFKN